MIKIALIFVILWALVITTPIRRKRDGREQIAPTKQSTGGFLSRFLIDYLQRRLARLGNRNQERRTPLMKFAYDFIAARMYAQGRNETIIIPTLEPTTLSFEDIMAKLSLEMLKRDAESQGKVESQDKNSSKNKKKREKECS